MRALQALAVIGSVVAVVVGIYAAAFLWVAYRDDQQRDWWTD